MKQPQRLARKQESRSNEYWGARPTPRSGSGDVKGDGYTDDELFEYKHTERLSFGLMYRMFWPLAQAALLTHRRPVMEIEYTTRSGGHPSYLVVLDRDDYKALRDELRELRAYHCSNCGC